MRLMYDEFGEYVSVFGYDGFAERFTIKNKILSNGLWFDSLRRVSDNNTSSITSILSKINLLDSSSSSSITSILSKISLLDSSSGESSSIILLSIKETAEGNIVIDKFLSVQITDIEVSINQYDTSILINQYDISAE